MLRGILDEKRKSLLRELHRQLAELRVLLVRVETSEEHQKALARAISQLDELFLLVVVGEFNAGKSAVINALLGEKVLEEGPTPTTSRVELVKYGAERKRTPAGGAFEEVALPLELLREMNIVDTPGTNAVVEGHEALTRDFVPRSELVLFVTSADRPFTESERQFLATIRDWGKKVVVAVNKIDILEGPADVEKVVEFVRDKLRELLGLRPEVFGVSARQTWKAKTAGYLPDAARNGFGALEAYLSRTLDDVGRLRVKLESPLGVADRAIEVAASGAKSRLATLAEDEAALKEVEGLIAQHLQETARDQRVRVSEAEKPLLELETRGDAFLDRTLRLPRALSLLDREQTAALFRQDVMGGLQAAIEKRADGLADAVAAADARLWPTVVERVNKRSETHASRGGGPPIAVPAPDQARLRQAFARDAARALESFSPREEPARFARAAQRSAAATLLLLLLAIVGAGIGLLQAETAATAVTAGVVGAVVALAAPLPLPIQRAREKARLGEAVGALRQRLAATLRAGCDRELELGHRKLQEAILPFARFVRADGERLRAQSQELAARKRDLDTLRTRIAGLR